MVPFEFALGQKLNSAPGRSWPGVAAHCSTPERRPWEKDFFHKGAATTGTTGHS